LAENVAQFPIPVITGIGHERDESILDMVSNTRVKTPTAAAALLIDNLRRVLERIAHAEDSLRLSITQRLNYQQQRLSQLAGMIPMLAQQLLTNSRHRIDILQQRLPLSIERMLTARKHQLAQLELKLQGFDPQLLLSRGYSITLLNGKAVRDPRQLKPGDEIETRVEKGTIRSVVK
jgi:exodeoxyribonuclease VII large subunit